MTIHNYITNIICYNNIREKEYQDFEVPVDEAPSNEASVGLKADPFWEDLISCKKYQ